MYDPVPLKLVMELLVDAGKNLEGHRYERSMAQSLYAIAVLLLNAEDRGVVK